MSNQDFQESSKRLVSLEIGAMILTALADGYLDHQERIAILQVSLALKGGELPVTKHRKSLEAIVEEVRRSESYSRFSMFERAREFPVDTKAEILLSALSIARLDAPYSLAEIKVVRGINVHMSDSDEAEQQTMDYVIRQLSEHGFESESLERKLEHVKAYI